MSDVRTIQIDRGEAIGRAITAALRAADKRTDVSLGYSAMASAWASIAACLRDGEVWTMKDEAQP